MFHFKKLVPQREQAHFSVSCSGWMDSLTLCSFKGSLQDMQASQWAWHDSRCAWCGMHLPKQSLPFLFEHCGQERNFHWGIYRCWGWQWVTLRSFCNNHQPKMMPPPCCVVHHCLKHANWAVLRKVFTLWCCIGKLAWVFSYSSLFFLLLESVCRNKWK